MLKNRFSLILSGLLLLSGCTAQSTAATTAPALTKYSNITLDAGFDTFISLQEYTDSQETFDAHFQTVTELFTYYNNLFDIYNTYEGMNNLKTINDNAGIQPVEVDPVLIEMLQEAKQFYDISGGEFDITMGALLQVWHQYREAGIAANEEGQYGTLPSQEELEEAARHRGWDCVEIDTENNTVYITDPEVSLDVGGIAKGFATEKVAQALESENLIGAAINAGGNNRTLGDKYDGSDWRVRIQNPDGGEKSVVVSFPGVGSFVTSGDYERYYIAEDGQRYSHIIDPSTLYPADRYRSVTIITKDSGAADCLSTTLFTLSIEEGRQVLQEYEELTGNAAEAVWILDADKAVEDANSRISNGFCYVWTDGLSDRLTFD